MTLLSSIWLWRHAQTLAPAGHCIGSTDVQADVAATEAAARLLLQTVQPDPKQSFVIWHSPLKRCVALAQRVQSLMPQAKLLADDRLREADFGAWENKPWDHVSRSDIDAWTADFLHHRPGGGESVQQVLVRVQAVLAQARTSHLAPQVVITHAGVIKAARLVAQGQLAPSAKDWPTDSVNLGEGFCLPPS
jgi:alpha-ribazole phosphatase